MKNKILATIFTLFIVLTTNLCAGFMIIPANEDSEKFCGSGNFISESEAISYVTKTTTGSVNIKSEVPNYTSQISNANCANVAGTILIGYYDRFCENLIPNYTAYVKLGNAIMYRSGSTETTQVMSSLYTLMETNVGGAGTTYDGFHNGMKSYINSKGYSYIKTALGKLDFESYKESIENNKPVALFLTEYSLIGNGADTGSVETIKSWHCSVAHVAVGYGYKIDTYFDANGKVVASRTYLSIASGLEEYGRTYLCLTNRTKIYQADSILIE